MQKLRWVALLVGLAAIAGVVYAYPPDDGRAQAPPPATVPSLEQLAALQGEVDALKAKLAKTNLCQVPDGQPERCVFHGELVVVDDNIYAVGDNTNPPLSPYVEDCLNNQTGGSSTIMILHAIVIGHQCTMGLYANARMKVTWDEHNPPIIDLSRKNCKVASCGMGYEIQYTIDNNKSNPLRLRACRMVLQTNELFPTDPAANGNSSWGAYDQCWTYNDQGQRRWALGTDPNNGILMFPGTVPTCELAGLSAAEQPARLWVDFANNRVMYREKFPSCADHQVWPPLAPGQLQAAGLDPNAVVLPPLSIPAEEECLSTGRTYPCE